MPKRTSIFTPQKSRRNLLPLGLVIFVVLGAAIYCIYWYLAASSTRKAVEQIIAQINSQQPLVTYQYIETSGFPNKVAIRIVQPKFSGRINVLLQDVAAKIAVQANPQPRDLQLAEAIRKLPEWTEEIAWAGSLNFSVNVASDTFDFSMEGPISNASTIGGQKLTMITQPASTMSCSLTLKPQTVPLANLWDIDRLTNLDNIMEDMRQFSCSNGGYTVTDDLTKEVMFSSGPAQLLVTHQPDPTQRTVGFVLRVQDAEAKQGLNRAMNRYLSLFAELPGMPPGFDLAAYGRQNMDIEVVTQLPLTGRPEDNFAAPFAISINRMEISNALQTLRLKMQMHNLVDANARAVVFNVDGETKFTDAYDKYFTNYVRMVVSQLKDSTAPEEADLKASLQNYTVDQAMEVLSPVIPRLAPFGTLTFKSDIRADGDLQLQKGTLAVNNFEVSAVPYGVTAKGRSTLPGVGLPVTPDANFTLTCRNCTLVVDDLSAYMRRLHAALGKFDPTIASMPQWGAVPLAEGIKTFITTVGDRRNDPATGLTLLLFTMASDQKNGITVNGKNPAQVMQSFDALVMPHIQTLLATPQPEPAAEAAPAAEAPEKSAPEKKRKRR